MKRLGVRARHTTLNALNRTSTCVVNRIIYIGLSHYGNFHGRFSNSLRGKRLEQTWLIEGRRSHFRESPPHRRKNGN